MFLGSQFALLAEMPLWYWFLMPVLLIGAIIAYVMIKKRQ